MPKPRGGHVSITAFVDASFAQNKRQGSHTLVSLYLLIEHPLFGSASANPQLKQAPSLQNLWQ